MPTFTSPIGGFKYAFTGLRHAFKAERNFRFHIVIAALAIFLGLLLKISLLEWSVLILTIAFVLSVELLNTALEAVIDLTSPSLHPLAKIVKDAAAAGVLVAAIGSVLIGLFIFLPHLL